MPHRPPSLSADAPAKSAQAPPKRAWQRMLSGRRLNLLDPSPLDIEITDIAHGLARVARWNGQTTGEHIFSVAQHSVLVEAIAGELNPQSGARIRLAVLLHDGAEYVVGDMISPFKAVLGPEYKQTETRIMEAILRRFGLAVPFHPMAEKLAKRADRLAAGYEAEALAGFSPEESAQIFGTRPALSAQAHALLAPMPIDAAQTLFLARFEALSARLAIAGEPL